MMHLDKGQLGVIETHWQCETFAVETQDDVQVQNKLEENTEEIMSHQLTERGH